jgi:hypothetical protein
MLLVGQRATKYYHLKAIVPSTEYLQQQLGSTNRIAVYSPDPGGPVIDIEDNIRVYPELYVDIADAAVVSDILSSIRIRRSVEFSFWSLPDTIPVKHCMCHGNFMLKFYLGNEELAAISFHHAQSIRWRDSPWIGDADLEEGSGERLVEILKGRGLVLPYDMTR